MQLEAQLAERNVTFELSKEMISWIAKKGFDDRMGARPLGRVIQEYIKKPLADEVLFGKLQKGGTVKVTLVKDKMGKEKLALESIEDKPVKKPAKSKAASKAKAKPSAKAATKPKSPPKPRGKGNGGGGASVPKVPLKTK